MKFLCPARRRSIAPVYALLIAGSFPAADAQEWAGDGPVLNELGSRKVHSLVINPAAGKIYAGAGSGTVFVRADASLSEAPQAFDDSAVTDPGVAVGLDVLVNDLDPEGALDAGSVELQTNPANGAAAIDTDGTVTYTPAAGFIGTDNFTYTVRDEAGNESNVASATVRVNAPPAAGDDAASTLTGETVIIDVLANDADPDGTVNPSAVAMWNSPANGDATVEPDGRVTYVPAPEFTGVDSFTYRVADNDGALSNEATVSVAVNPSPNTAPVAHDDNATSEGAAVTIPVLDNDTDPDGMLDPATATVQGAPANGNTAVNGDGSITYTPDAGFSGADTFTYTVADDDGAVSNPATVTVTVTLADVNSPPVAVDDTAATEADTPVTVDVLANDRDDDGTLRPETVAVQGVPAHGGTTVDAGGSITYMPDAGFTGTDSFTYTVADNLGERSNAATVEVSVDPAAAPPRPPPPPASPPAGGGGPIELPLLIVLTLAAFVGCFRRQGEQPTRV